ncbi:hypothetical protein CDL15_Pgr021322 [Punica granatum]|uniref:TFIIS N-terminal domain-containing protein n=1 Tax=Punica granatum TaxID=22663 RepID=A0A218WRW2_PUNGR|nr:hypothetical protein CDL15_Pgr021322 [Punica granatum]PKI39135.1 hypothetical protein CRG98_040472 [Punica granatum]
MTLEDFFTLTEMKDGLTATSRVEELVAVMQKEKDSAVNPVDAIRQWAAVASIIASTDNKDCLDLFVQLGGLLFIDRWLKDAENFGSKNGDSFEEESITALLLALEKLCIDKERSISSGIWVTVGHLLDHHNVKVQNRARAVFGNWNHGDSDALCRQLESSAPVNEGASGRGDVGREIGEVECSPSSIPSRGEKEDTESCVSEAMRTDNLPSQSSNATEPERLEDVQTKHEENQLRSNMVIDTCDSSCDPLLSSIDAPGHEQEGTDVQEKTSIETCGPDVSHSSSFDKTDMVPPEDKKPVDKLNSGPENSSILAATDAFEQANVSSDAEAVTSEEIAAVSVGTKMDVDESNHHAEAAAVPDHQTPATEPQIETVEVPKVVEDNDCSSNAAKNAPDNKLVSEKLDGLDNSLLSKEVGAATKCKETARDRYKEVSNLSALYGGRKGNRRSKRARGKKSTIELEYGILDALDIARQVAKEVEREVTDYKEPFCSTSSERSSGGIIGEPMSPDSINDSASSPSDTSSDELSTGESQSAEGDGRRSTRSGNGDSKTKDPVEDVASSHMTEAKVKTDKGFDLNEEVCSDDGGSKALFNEELRDSSSQVHKRLDIDLNMAEAGEDTSIFPATGNHIPASSSVNSKGSSGEANQGRSERPNLDLNSTGDDDDDVVISDSHHFTGRICPSPASSSSQMQPHERNFDLNDQPYSSFNDPFSDQASHHNSPSCGTRSLGRPGKPTVDPFISIMGTKVEISKGGLVPQRTSDLSNGKTTLEPSSGGAPGLGPAVSSLYSPPSRCSALPTGHTISFSPYGPNEPTRYVVDPRVAPILPGAPGPTPALYSPYSMPFAMSLNAGPSQPQFDLNSNFSVDGANRDPGFLMQLFPPSHVKATGEHPSALLHPFSGSIVGGKRKEPESGWDPYSVSYGQFQSPWK